MSTPTHATIAPASSSPLSASELDRLLDLATEVGRGSHDQAGPPAHRVDELLRAYYGQVAAEDVLDRSPTDLYGGFAAHLRLARERPQGTATVRVTTPTQADDGWSAAGHTVVEVVVDDMPFLVDSVTMGLSRQRRDVHDVVRIHLRRPGTIQTEQPLQPVHVDDPVSADRRATA